MGRTRIEWCDTVWNPTVGCTKVSQGCKNCYAERDYGRWYPDVDFHQVQLKPDRLEQPLHWTKPRRIFVDSVSDLFHKEVPINYIAKVFAVMAIAKQHTYMILTKRAKRMSEWLSTDDFQEDIAEEQERICEENGWCSQDFDYPLPNVWLGVSAEDQDTANERIPLLLSTPAILRFVSVEPMLGPIDISYFLNGCPEQLGYGYAEDYEWQQTCPPIQWVICGCESGVNARKTRTDWIQNLRDQCKNARVPFFLKQIEIYGRLIKMPVLDGQVWAEYPRINV